MKRKTEKRYRKNSYPTRSQQKRNRPGGRKNEGARRHFFDSLIKGLSRLKEDK